MQLNLHFNIWVDFLGFCISNFPSSVNNAAAAAHQRKAMLQRSNGKRVDKSTTFWILCEYDVCALSSREWFVKAEYVLSCPFSSYFVNPVGSIDIPASHLKVHQTSRRGERERERKRERKRERERTGKQILLPSCLLAPQGCQCTLGSLVI
jgi:hypothetical protein